MRANAEMFLHLIHADGKFLPQIRSTFEAAAPGRHEYVFVDFLQRGSRLPPGLDVLRDPADFAPLLARTSRDGVVVHGVRFEAMDLLLDVIPARLPLAWYVWGFEAYSYWPPLRRDLLLPRTRRLASRLAGQGWRAGLGPLRGIRTRRALRESMLRVARRYRLFAAPFIEEYDLFTSTGLLAGSEFHRGTYGSIEDYVDVGGPLAWGEDCQVGNSGAVANNHLDAFTLLPGHDADERRVVVPLTYGDGAYSRVVADEGRLRFGERFVPLLDFVPRPEYERLLLSCGHVVMDQRRQQAVGNVLAALWRGATVYMNDTTFFRALRRMGFDVKLIDGCRDASGSLCLAHLTDDAVARHRDLLRLHWDRTTVVAETRDLLERLAAARA